MLFLFVSSYAQQVLTTPVVKEKIKVKLAPAFPTGAPTILTEDIIQTPPLVTLKKIKNLSMQSKAATYLLNISMHNFL